MPLGDLPSSACQPASPCDGTRSIEALEDEITTLAAHLTAATYRLLQLIAEFDRRQGWGGFGMTSCAHWLTWRCGIGVVAAREKVRVARALEALPQISNAMRTGTVSYSKARALTRIATPANEKAVLAVALNGTAQHVERMAQIYRRTGRVASNDEALKHERERELSYYWDEDGFLVISGRLPPEQGAVVVKALQMAGDALARDAEGKDSAEAPRTGDSAEALRGLRVKKLDGESVELNPWRARQADALAVVAEAALAHGARGASAGERHVVTLHVDAAALAGQSACCEKSGGEAWDVSCHLSDGPAVAREVARRFACDASVVAMVEGARGEVLDVGRKTRVVSTALRRALEHRDGGCRFPGCRNRRVDAHHIEHWANGGETKLANLVLLCRRHHGLVHEGGLSIALVGDEVVVRRADGRVIDQVPKVAAVRDSAEAFAREHEGRGIAIDARTSTPGWGGERADYGYIVAMLDDHERASTA